MVLIILLGGCQVDKDETSTNPSEIDKEDLPEVRAFNDSFTREFLQPRRHEKDIILLCQEPGNLKWIFRLKA